MKSMAYRWEDITPGDTDSQTDSDEEQEDLSAGSGTYIEGQYIDPEGPLGREDDIETGIVQQEGPAGRGRGAVQLYITTTRIAQSATAA